MTEKLTSINLQGWPTTATSIIAIFVLSAATVAGSVTLAQTPQSNFPLSARGLSPAQDLHLPALPTPQSITPNGSVVEDVVARVNDQIITRTEYQAAEDQLLQEARQQNISQAALNERLHDLLRDMIDEQLLLSKGKELGITGDAETMRELDDIRKKNNIASMEDLEKAAEAQGVSFEDFKQHITDQIVRQQVVRDQVGAHLNMTHADEMAYYTAHAQDFTVPEQLHLSEILIPTSEKASDADIAAAQSKADQLSEKLKAGANFAELAKTSSGGPTASAGGDLGDFKRGTLGDILEKATFSLPAGGNTPPIRTRQGFVILHVDSHQAAGVPPFNTIEPKVQEALYFQQLQPALRAYLTKARKDAYLDIDSKDGFVDTGSPTKQAKSVDIAYTAYKAPVIKKKVAAKQRLEQEKANRAQVELAAARARVAEKEAMKAADAEQKSGAKNADKPYKPKKIHREKIRFGQAPEKALPAVNAQTASVDAGTPIGGTTAGAAMASTESVTSITTGTGADADSDPLAAKEGPRVKTRFSAHENEAEETEAKAKLAKAEAKASTRPLPETPADNATEKHQAAPLGLNGDTTKKPKKPKRKKGEVKERMQEKAKPAAPPSVAPTVNPDIGVPSAITPSSTGTVPQH